MNPWRRWMRFNTVGAIGVLVQLAALAIFKSVLGINYLVATALAVETAVVHNFVWHERWTWRDRPGAGRLMRFVRFNLANGLVSILANLALMRLLVGRLHLPYLAANLLSIAICSIANFLLSDRLVFSPGSPSGAAARRR